MNQTNSTSPLNKLNEIIRKEVGKVTESYFQHNSGAVISETIKLLADTNNSVTIDQKDNASEKQFAHSLLDEQDNTNERAKSRENFQSQKKQLNVENITAFAADDLKQEANVTSEPVDEDWTSRFFSIAEEISNEEMQALWGRILAGEIKRPKSFSLRTLEMIKTLSKEEAGVIMKIANFVIEINETFILFQGDDQKVLEKHGISFGMITLLIELGIIQPGDFIQYNLKSNVQRQGFIFGKTIVIADRSENTPEISFPIYLLTKVGIQLLALMKIEPPFEYLKAFGNYLTKQQYSVGFSEITLRESGTTHFKQPLLKFLD